jgi:hypothetical protein
VRRLVEALRARGDVEVIEPPPRRRLEPGRAAGRWNPLRSAANALLDAAWLNISLPRAARRAGADVLHHALPAHSAQTPCPEVITVHDVALPSAAT